MSPLRRLGRAVTGPNTRFLLHTQANLWRERGFTGAARWNAMLADAWLRDRVARRRYATVSPDQATAARKSERVFVFGSGYSLNALTDGEWTHFRAHDVFGFNAFYHQRWVPVDFHLLRVGIYGSLQWRAHAREIADALSSNAAFARTIFVLQSEYLGHMCNQLVGYGYLPAGARVLRYHTARGEGLPSRDLRDGVRHAGGTLADAVNVAYALGWREIVLVGVDLYDSRYFYLPPDRTTALDAAAGTVVPSEYNLLRGIRYDQSHQTVRLGIVRIMDEWRRHLEADGVRLSVYNPRSLLADVLPVYERA